MANDKSTFTQELGYIIDQFDELQDLRWSDLQYLDEYRELKMKKNDGLPVDQNRLNILEETFKNKIITSARWNKFQNALLGMQTFIKTEVNNYIDTEIEKFQYRGTYNPSIQYFQRNMVDYNDGAGVQTYLCIANSMGNLPTNPLYFKKLTVKGERGEQGLAGIGLKFRGLWNENATYNADDGVQYGGILYASLIDGNIGNQPNPSLNTEYWVKALDVTVTVKKMIGTRNIATQTSNVNFITGEIISFNLGIDSLEVYQNSVRLTKGIDYTINPNNQSIDKISGVWEASIEQPIFFEFVVTKNILNNLVFSDGSAIENGTVAKSKLTTDVQEELDKIGILQTEVNEHMADDVSQGELHGFRLTGGKLEYFDGQEWQRVKGDGYPVGNTSNFNAKSDDKQITLTWRDPDDVTVTDSNDNIITIARWKGTKILRKTGSYPQNENDGVLVIDNGIRNQYAESGFTDTGLQNDIEYFYMAFPYTEEDVYTVDESNRISAIPTEIKIYGIEVDESNSNPATRIIYTDDAIGMTPMRGNNGNLDYGSWESIIKDEFGINSVVLQNMAVNYYLNSENRNQKADGSPSVLNGNDGDVMTEIGNTIYYKWTVNGSIHHKQVSSKPFEGATAKAFEVEEGYNLVPFETLKLLQILYELFFCHHDSQTALGRGRVGSTTGYAGTGGTDAKGMTYGSTADEQMSFLGIEDFWGNKLWWVDGLVTDSNHNILIGNGNFNDTGSGYTSYPSGISTNTGGYMDKVQGGNDLGFILKSAGGSETTHYADSAYLYSGCGANFGGSRSYGSTAGAFNLRLYYSASTATATIGARLFCAKNGKLYIGAYLGTSSGGKLRSISGTAEPTGSKTIGAFRTEARANN